MNGLDWGTVPAWASAIGTSGSLLLGFSILLRDRRKEERREALRVVAYHYREGGNVRIHLRNMADRPITYPRVLTSGQDFPFDVAILEAGEEAVVNVPRYVDHGRTYPIAVVFVDADGYQWVRDLQSGDVFHRTRFRRGEPSARLLLRPRFWGQFWGYRERKRALRRL